MEFTPVILIHMLTATGAIAIGGLTFTLKKGTPLHRLFGRLWVGLMLSAALVSFGIQNSGHFSWIHLLSIFTLVSVSAAVYAAVKGRIDVHRRGMTHAYIALLVAGAFTFLPQRRLGHLLWQAVGLT
ncbi:DUF2306 domain-containing protein [Noviherbaspirillum sp.]|jgi:uncharacterized membrane protein|uniref:DUF2306 domain-containing protein n=1 Tax=Noviherbaspirillum sp. TaxID=1926288 RepID=UPI0025D504B4|nr:DUF2306 domain-containing protein [Noviherbaspirillum sp.]HJV51843.1 DUF2306 domain-containing protein [Noviherbaspirillum sp.]